MKTERATVDLMIKSAVNYARWIVFLQVAILILFLFKMRTTSHFEKQALEARLKSEMTEKTTLGFMQRTVERWEKLGNDNPHVQVPEVIEPMVTPPK